MPQTAKGVRDWRVACSEVAEHGLGVCVGSPQSHSRRGQEGGGVTRRTWGHCAGLRPGGSGEARVVVRGPGLSLVVPDRWQGALLASGGGTLGETGGPGEVTLKASRDLRTNK